MFQFLRRVSGSLLPRPDRPWRDDATSHAPTIGRKRRYSVTEQDIDDFPSAVKKMKNDPIQHDADSDSASDQESQKGDVVSLVEGREVKEVTKGVKEVDLEGEEAVEDASSIPLDGVPLPDSPSGSPEPESESSESIKSDAVQETADEVHEVDKEGSVASSAPENHVDEEPETEPTMDGDASRDGTAPAQGVALQTVELDLNDVPEILEAKA